MEETKERERAPGVEPSSAEIHSYFDSTQLSLSDNLIGALQQTQAEFGYLPAEALKEIARRTKTPLARVHGVVSFYTQFYTEPRGRHTIMCCRGTACHVKGATRVIDALKQELEIDEGETTPDMMFSLETVLCTGACFLAPVMMIGNQYYGKLTPQKISSILKSYRENS